jgi:hypothetical protein
VILATYPTTHAVLSAEKRLKARGIMLELVPVPRSVRSSCGFGILADLEPGLLRETGAEALWRVLEPAPPARRRTYERLP